MQKFILGTALTLFSLITLSAQEFKIGINGGLPVGDFSEFDSFTIQADFTYLFEVSDRFEAGPVLSVYHFFGAEVDVFSIAIPDFGDPFNQTVRTDDTTFIPIGGTARFSIIENLILGVDLGYAIGTKPFNGDGGFYYRPQVLYMVSNNFGIKASYSKVKGFNFSSVNLGIEFGL